MKMPSHKSAAVTREKVTDYLLSSFHPRGSMKARWFALLGYSEQEPDELEKSLLGLANGDIQSSDRTAYGDKYVIAGSIIGPNGQSAEIISVWMIPTGESVPKLVTAYPSK